MTSNLRITLAAAALCAMPVASDAHHSFAMFANDKTVVVTGTVKEFEWVNPHSWLHVMVPAGGKSEEWAFEMGSPSMMAAKGFLRS